MGSKSLAAMATFEDRFRHKMTREEAMQLVRYVFAAGMFNDLGSGSNVYLCVITKDRVECIRPREIANQQCVQQGGYLYKSGTTAVLSSEVKKIEIDVFGNEITPQPMDTQ